MFHNGSRHLFYRDVFVPYNDLPYYRTIALYVQGYKHELQNCQTGSNVWNGQNAYFFGKYSPAVSIFRQQRIAFSTLYFCTNGQKRKKSDSYS